VKSVLVTQSHEHVPIDYLLDREAAGWRVHDVTIEGVSLVNNYRTQFRRYLVNHSFAELLTRLESHLGAEAP
jgi:phospholipid transport system substrate-binding protein